MTYRRLLLVLVALAAAVPAAAASAPDAGADATVAAQAGTAICHRTTSTRRPYTKLRVSGRTLRRHGRHAADIIPAPRGACPRTILSPTRGGTELTATLTGEAEEPRGDPVATGTATIRLRRGQGQVCFILAVNNLGVAGVGAHIHRGAVGTAGGIVVGLRATNALGGARGCVSARRDVVRDILRNPSAYYVNIHTQAFPAGAVRGQLGTQADVGRTISTQLTGAAECNTAGQCGLGDPDGSGTAIVRFRREAGQVCFRITVSNIQLPAVGAHIHRGGRTTAGPIVVGFTNPDAAGTSSGCTTATQALIDEILANPANFYVNVHSRDFPAGAVRGQLA